MEFLAHGVEVLHEFFKAGDGVCGGPDVVVKGVVGGACIKRFLGGVSLLDS